MYDNYPDAPKECIPDDEFWDYSPYLESVDPDIYAIGAFYYQKRGDYWYLIKDGHYYQRKKCLDGVNFSMSKKLLYLLRYSNFFYIKN